jgi:hypothetical protein
LVVEPQERDQYAFIYGKERILELPWNNPGSVIPARNWIKQHATEAGHLRHWQLDDNIRMSRRFWKGKRLPITGGIALKATEDFVDRYENIAIAGLNYTMFITGSSKVPPFFLNVHVYSCTLVLNSIPNVWRGRYNEDTDMCLQVLADGWCTVLMNAFMVDKMPSMTMDGGNTKVLYQGDGRLRMARSLERSWPGVVETKRRFRRPQHVIKNQWRYFDTPLKLKPEFKLQDPAPNEYGMRLAQVKPEIQSTELRRIAERYNDGT